MISRKKRKRNPPQVATTTTTTTTMTSGETAPPSALLVPRFDIDGLDGEAVMHTIIHNQHVFYTKVCRLEEEVARLG